MSEIVQARAAGYAIAARNAGEFPEAPKCRLHSVLGESLPVLVEEQVRDSRDVCPVIRRVISAQYVI
jgi:hypothetical protein